MGNAYTQLLCHLVFSTQDRRAFIEAELRTELYPFIADTVRRHGGHLIAIGGMPDHVHLLTDLRPDVSVSSIVRFVKSNSSRWVRSERNLEFGWQNGYAAFSVSRSGAQRVARYIQNQEAHHRGITFEEEITALLERHEISFDSIPPRASTDPERPEGPL